MKRIASCIPVFGLLLFCGCAETWLKPKDAEGYYNRGVAFGRQGDYDKQVADLSEAIKLDPRNAKAFYSRGVAYQQRWDHDKAIADFTEVIRLDPAFVDAYFNRGLAYERKADKAAADSDWNVAYARSDNCSAAVADFTEVIRLIPNSANAYYCRGLAYRKKGDETNAQNDLEQARKLGYKPS